MYFYENAKTQKAKSVLLACPMLQWEAAMNSVRSHYIDKLYLKLNSGNAKPIFFQSLHSINQFILNNQNFWSFTRKVFARPCPLTPRHGFVDSKVIDSHVSLYSLFEELEVADPSGELIISEFIDEAVASAVLTTSGTLSIGPSYNGATSGYASISFPVKPETLSPEVMLAAGLNPSDTAFLEAVFPSPKNETAIPFQITQIRGGPSIPTVSDFIPVKTKVIRVVYPHDDLLLWESQAKKFEAGTVVYGRGHSLASHAAVHCIINNIPFVTSFEPKVGTNIVPTANKAIDLDKAEFLKGVHASLSKTYSPDIMLHLSACVLHNWAYIRTSAHASWLLGMAASYMCQVLAALCFGEYRHSKVRNKFHFTSRELVYKEITQTKKFSTYIQKAPSVAVAFVDKKRFPRPKEFGGSKWAKATKMSIKIWNSIITIQNRGLTPLNINRLINNINKSTNLVHNGGWLFNKFSSQERLNKISKTPSLSIFELSDFIYELHQLVLNTNVTKKLPIIKV